MEVCVCVPSVPEGKSDVELCLLHYYSVGSLWHVELKIKWAFFFLWPQVANWVPRRMRCVLLSKPKAHIAEARRVNAYRASC